MAGKLSKQYLQPGSAKHRVLRVLADNGRTESKALDAFSPYDTPVYSREAYVMVKSHLLSKEFTPNSLRTAFAITDLGRSVLEDADAYHEEFSVKKLTKLIDKQTDTIKYQLALDTNGKSAMAQTKFALQLLEAENCVDTAVTRTVKAEFYRRVAGFAIIIAEALEVNYQSEELSAGMAKEIIYYMRRLEKLEIAHHFGQDFLRKLMVARLES